MTIVEGIRKKIQQDEFEFSKHAVDQSIVRRISVQEMRDAILGDCELIEDYPDDKYGPSCLILGFTKKNRPLHIVCSYPSRIVIKIITLYEPDSTIWTNFKIRKKK